MSIFRQLLAIVLSGTNKSQDAAWQDAERVRRNHHEAIRELQQTLQTLQDDVSSIVGDSASGTPAGTGVVYDTAGTLSVLTDTELTTHVRQFSDTTDGAVPAPNTGGGHKQVLYDDLDWDVIPGSNAFYGTGIDGAKTVSGTETLTREMHWTTLVVPSGAVLVTDGYPFRCTVSIEIQSGGKITANGKAASGATAGGATSGTSSGTRPLGGGTAGTNGGTGAGGNGVASSAHPAMLATTGAGSGKGGVGGAGVSGGGNGGVQSDAVGGGAGSTLGSPLTFPYLIQGQWPSNSQRINGGTGGGAGGGGGAGVTGGGGGGGAAPSTCASPLITNNGAYEAIGGAGGNAAGAGNGGGGAGGGGGKVHYVCSTFTGTAPDVSGGGGGSPVGTGTTGGTGSTGSVIGMTGC